MKLTMLLADAAQEVGGKVYALGLGWNITGTPTPAMALVVMIDVGWEETNENLHLRIELVDADGHTVMVPGPLGEQPLCIEAHTQAGRPPGVPRGSEIRIPMTVSIAQGLALVPGQRYEWRATINGNAGAEWRQGFYVMPTQPQIPQ